MTKLIQALKMWVDVLHLATLVHLTKVHKINFESNIKWNKEKPMKCTHFKKLGKGACFFFCKKFKSQL